MASSLERRSVMIVDDDEWCLELVRSAFESTDHFRVTHEFNGLEEFCRMLPVDPLELQRFLPDLIVMDVLSARERKFRDSGLNGATLLLYLRKCGFQFATLLVSGMASQSLLKYVQTEASSGWSFLVKDFNLSSASIVESARVALESGQQ